jgi:hypothetical protein
LDQYGCGHAAGSSANGSGRQQQQLQPDGCGAAGSSSSSSSGCKSIGQQSAAAFAATLRADTAQHIITSRRQPQQQRWCHGY